MPTRVLECPKCGSTERRPNWKRCAGCHRAASIRSNREAREQPPIPGLTRAESALFTRLLADDFDDIQVTPVMRAYLKAFDAYITASKAGALSTKRAAKTMRRRLLQALEGPVEGAVFARDVLVSHRHPGRGAVGSHDR